MANKALLCGINNYQTQSALRGCINDVKNMSEVLTKYFDFASDNIHQLTDEQVTKRAIMNEYQWLLDGAKSGDNLVFQFSGHGSYIPDEQGDEVDGTDEILCLYDIDFYNPETYICDDEWNALMAELATDVQLTLIFDNCHSGTGTRAITITLNGQKETLWVDVATTEKRGISSPFESKRSLQELKSLEPGEYQDLLQSRSVILPRFLAPPVAMQERIIAAARTRGLRTQAPPPPLEKHLFLAGCLSYEGLRELEDLSLPGRVNNFFTVGSALSLGPVYSSLRRSNKDGDLPAGVTRWINLDAKGRGSGWGIIAG